MERRASRPSGFQRSRARARAVPSSPVVGVQLGQQDGVVGVGEVVGAAPDPDPRRVGADRQPEHAEVAGRQVVDARPGSRPAPRERWSAAWPAAGRRCRAAAGGSPARPRRAAGAAGARGRRARRRRRARRSAATVRRASRSRPSSSRAPPTGSARRGTSGVRASGEPAAGSSETGLWPASTSYDDPVRPARSQGTLAELGARSPTASRTDDRRRRRRARGGRRRAPRRTSRPRRFRDGEEPHQRSDAPSPPPACSSKFSCSMRCRTGYGEVAAGLGGPVEAEELGDEVLLGEDDRLAAVDLLDLRGQRVDRVAGDELAVGGRAGGLEHRDRVRELALGVVAGLLDELLRVDVVERQRTPGHQVGAARRRRPARPATRAAAVVERHQHVVGRPGPRCPRGASGPGHASAGGEVLLDQQDDVVRLEVSATRRL